MCTVSDAQVTDISTPGTSSAQARSRLPGLFQASGTIVVGEGQCPYP
jgi:hypothetical protein